MQTAGGFGVRVRCESACGVCGFVTKRELLPVILVYLLPNTVFSTLDQYVMNWTHIIKEIARGKDGARDLPPDEATRLYGALLDGQVGELESGAIAIALRMKGESASELAAFLAAIDARMPAMAQPAGMPRPIVVPTYNGARRAANLTPLLMLALRELEVPVLAHGLQEDFGRVTSAQILMALDVPPAPSVAVAQGELSERGLSFLSTGLLLPGLAQQLNLRARLGLRNCAHSLVKMLDPFGGGGVVLASATHPPYIESMRTLLCARRQRALLFRGCEGEPYANPKRCPRIECIDENGVAGILFEAEGDSLRSLPDLPDEATALGAARWIRQVLAGEAVLPGPLAKQLTACLLSSGASADLDAAGLRVAHRFRLH